MQQQQQQTAAIAAAATSSQQQTAAATAGVSTSASSRVCTFSRTNSDAWTRRASWCWRALSSFFLAINDGTTTTTTCQPAKPPRMKGRLADLA